MTKTEKLLYTAKTHTTGGREHGVSRSSDGHLDIRLSTPGGAGIGTNPEQLFAAGWSACSRVRWESLPTSAKSSCQKISPSTRWRSHLTHELFAQSG